MRLKNGNEYIPQQEEKKQSLQYTMIAVICVCLVLIGTVFAIRSYPQWMAKRGNNGIDLTNEQQKQQVVPNQDVVKQVPTVDSRDAGKPSESESNSGKKSAFISPVSGTIVKDFAMDVPIYSKTLDEFTVHAGIDIEAPLDTQVCAAAAGTVTKVYTDDRLGITIQITHEDGLISQYSNLSTNKMIEEGDVVKQGDVISGVGNTALFESLDAPHLHFEIQKNGEAQNPTSYIK
ncbi:M23 family metallopeptidase [Sinanaerobacter sp. ZZT-01]|uniref:M23 family metallopeptidase n=1 Tax=Sinanaerobacter sp. ZZT-01 TaxID=3111540 RepID=UPI002D78EDA8|nr:M23 family metallopeptidase [Sinanaerobacter sp. ZZT-01]WRR92117.1 M23 family metallopeptidase [Sinanaerobacter sp. ZZT-01]